MNEWNLKLIYESDSLWEADMEKLSNDITSLKAYEGKLNNKESLEAFYVLLENTSHILSKLYVYASMRKDLNQKIEANATAYARIYSKYMEFINAVSFADPEILTNKESDVLSWCNDGKLLEYKFSISNIFRSNMHVLDAKSEAILSSFNTVGSGYNQMYDELAVKDFVPVRVKLSDGTELDISTNNMAFYLMQLENQDDRRIVFEALYKYYNDHKNTFSQIYNGILQNELTVAKNRGFNSILESKLFNNNIPTDVYLSLINTVKENTAPLKRYYALRKKFFKLDQIHTYDRFLKFSTYQGVYSYEDAKREILEADEFMGPDFHAKACKVLEDGRVSVESGEGKRGGAYSTGLYDEGAFIMLNYQKSLNEAFTIAHEAGHSIHTLYSNEAQPEATADYTIFVAEVASTFNEAVYLDYKIAHAESDEEKLVLLQKAIDNLVATFYRQTLFADYEYQAHKLAEEGTPISASVLSNIMKDLYKTYYDINLDDEKYKEFIWIYIPHLFHTPFYVYQYATSFAASQSLYTDVKNKVDGAFDRYINLLKSGGSNYPVELLKAAGCDLTTNKPFVAVVDRFNELLDELEKIVG